MASLPVLLLAAVTAAVPATWPLARRAVGWLPELVAQAHDAAYSRRVLAVVRYLGF